MRENKEFCSPLFAISLLGKFSIKIDDSPIDEKNWARRSAKSLIKLLALKPFHSLHREQIMDLLWAEDSPETASNNLNKAIYAARRTLEPDLTKGSDSQYIITSKNQIFLNSHGSLWVDLDEFERLANYALQNNDFTVGKKAVELYRGDLLIEDIYDDWIYTRRESVRILFRKTATKVSEFYAENGEHTKGIEVLRKLVAEDTTDEYAHRLLMQFYAETGNKYQALKQFEQCRTALHNLGVEPEPETIELKQKINNGEIIRSKNRHKSAETIISHPRVTPLTFQNGIIKSAKFMPDGETVILSAAWEGRDLEIYKMSIQTQEMHGLGITNGEILSVSTDGKAAIILKNSLGNGFNHPGTLAIIDLAVMSPRKLLKNIQWADWHPSKNANSGLPDEQFLAIVRDRRGRNCLEYPVDNVIFETGGWIGHPRFSPDGKKIAFIEHPIANDDEGFIVLLDLKDKSLKKQILTNNWLTISGLAWSNNEIWFTASNEAKMRSINAVNLKGEERIVYRELGKLRLHDISKSGVCLVTEDRIRNHTTARYESDSIERDLSWHDYTIPRDITDDGKKILIEVVSISSGSQYLTYMRNIDGTSTKLIGSGAPIAFSPDEKYALVRIPNPNNHLSLINLETSEAKNIETDSENSLIYQEFACFFPDGKRILFAANKLNSGTKLYTQKLDGSSPVCLIPDEEGLTIEFQRSISPDGKYIILKNSEGKLLLFITSNNTYKMLKNLKEDFSFIRWNGDGQSIFIRRSEELPAVIYKYDLATESMKKWLELMPKDSTGVNQINIIKLTPNGETYAYSYKRQSSNLYLIEDLV